MLLFDLNLEYEECDANKTSLASCTRNPATVTYWFNEIRDALFVCSDDKKSEGREF